MEKLFRKTEKKLSTVPFTDDRKIRLTFNGTEAHYIIELTSCAHRRKFKSEFLYNISEYSICLNNI